MSNKVDEIKKIIIRFFDKNTGSWQDYERAKQLIQVGFTPDEYSHLIGFIASYIGV